jgi:hypothetical protein
MLSSPLRVLLTLCLLTLAPSARAQSGPIGFQSPSKNITCQYFDYDKQNTLRCDISAMETKPRRLGSIATAQEYWIPPSRG